MSKRSASTEMVPAVPFANWLNERVKYWEQRAPSTTPEPGETAFERGAGTRVLGEIGWQEGDSALRRLYKYRYRRFDSKKKVNGRFVRYVYAPDCYPRDIVEDALDHAGVPFADLYPEIAAADEVELEPETWCPACREHRTPIDGLCPFDDWRIGPPTGQRLAGRLLRSAA